MWIYVREYVSECMWVCVLPLTVNVPAEIVFEMFDWNMILAHKRMGTCRLPLACLLDGNQFDHWIRLQSMKKSDRVTGGIHIHARYRPLVDNSEDPLFTAIKNSDLTKVEKFLMEPRPSINIKDEYGFTPLHSACVLFSENDEEIITCLLNHPGKKCYVTNLDILIVYLRFQLFSWFITRQTIPSYQC